MYSKEHRAEKQRDATRRYREKNLVKDKARAAARYQEQKRNDPDFLLKRREQTRQWRAANPQAVKEIQQRNDKKRYWVSKKEAFAVLGNKCAKCPWTDERALQIDHIIAIGDAERRRTNQLGRHLYKAVIENPNMYQLLCANCNWIKRHDLKE